MSPFFFFLIRHILLLNTKFEKIILTIAILADWRKNLTDLEEIQKT